MVGRAPPVEVPDVPEGVPDVVHLARRDPVAGVMDPGILPVPQDQVVDSQAGVTDRGLGEATAMRQPLGDETVILGSADPCAVGAQLVVPTVESDDGVSAGLVEAIGGELFGEAGHVR